MYKEHPVFEKPNDANVEIWRYLDFTKFVSLLDKQALFFSRADNLPDKFEGSYSKANVRFRPLVYRDLPKNVFDNIQKQHQFFSREIRKFTILSCWHINDYESAAMWKLYLKSDEGVAIQSTFKRLTESFNNYLENDVFIGKVKYIDYDTQCIPEDNSFYPFVHKRKSFEHERELRAIIQKLPVEDNKLDLTKELFDFGAYIPVDLDTLIEKIFISPTASEWFNELVKSIVNKYNLGKEVIQSNLADGPVY